MCHIMRDCTVFSLPFSHIEKMSHNLLTVVFKSKPTAGLQLSYYELYLKGQKCLKPLKTSSVLNTQLDRPLLTYPTLSHPNTQSVPYLSCSDGQLMSQW